MNWETNWKIRYRDIQRSTVLERDQANRGFLICLVLAILTVIALLLWHYWPRLTRWLMKPATTTADIPLQPFSPAEHTYRTLPTAPPSYISFKEVDDYGNMAVASVSYDSLPTNDYHQVKKSKLQRSKISLQHDRHTRANPEPKESTGKTHTSLFKF